MYNSPLLDELHYHFPALLYEPDLFTGVRDVFAYIQHQMRQRYDLFSMNQRGYARMGRLPWTPPSYHQGGAVPRFPPAGPGGRQTQLHPLPPQPQQRRQPVEEIRVTVDTFDVADPLDGFTTARLLGGGGAIGRALGTQNLDILTALINLTAGAVGVGGGAAGAAAAAAAAAMDPVVVRPTAIQIDAGTAIEIMDAEEDVCAICQDTMESGSQVRVINACDHRFHVTCIDTWFQRNVRCPVCRHDIRDPPEEDTDSTGSIS